MFTQSDFEIFLIEGLAPRMSAIRSNIQPLFQSLGESLVANLEKEVGQTFPLHIAQHRQRRQHAPEYTWMAMGGDQRGYKKYPHFTLGITRDFITLWLSFIDNPVGETQMAAHFLENLTSFEQLPADFVVNFDHTKNTYQPLEHSVLEKGLVRWQRVKKGEFQLGRVILKENEILKNREKTEQLMLATYLELVPFYQAALRSKEGKK